MSDRQMSTRDLFIQATNQRDAMLVLADALDRIEAALAQPQVAADPWASDWSTAPSPSAPQVPGPPPAAMASELAGNEAAEQRRLQAIAATRLQLAEADDPEDIDALNAKLRLLQDTAANIMPPRVPEGQRTRIASDGVTGEVDLIPATPERQLARAEWANEVQLWEHLPTLTTQQTLAYFAKGGAAWLVLSARDVVLGMPFEWRQWLVRDVAVDSQAEAQEMGADILKQHDSIDRHDNVSAALS